MNQKICQSPLVTRLSFRTTCIAFAGWIVAGCADSTGPTALARIATPAATIALQATPQFLVLNTTLTVTNTSGFPMAFSACGVSLEKLGLPELPPGKSEWTTVWSQICALIDIAGDATGPLPQGSDAILQPGETATLSIYAPVGQQPFPQFDAGPGPYRFHVPLSIVVLGSYRAVAPESSVSNPFTLAPPSA